MASDRPDTGTAPSTPDGDERDTQNSGAPSAGAQTPSPWWTAPGGKPIGIPAFGRIVNLDALAALLFPAPRMIPIRVRANRRPARF